MSQVPTPDEIREIASRLKPAELLVLPFYHDLTNELINPDQVRVQTKYFWEKWAPKLGPTMTALVITLRSYCYFNKLTREKRDWCYPEQATLAKQIGVSERTVRRELADNPYVPYFIRREKQYRLDATERKPHRTTDMYFISMDDPIAPEDEGKLAVMAAERILRDAQKTEPLPYTGQNDRNREPAVDNPSYTGQTGRHIARPNWPGRTSTSKSDKNVNVTNAFENSPKTEPQDATKAPQSDVEARHAWLVGEILAVTGDGHSRRYYARLVRELPGDTILGLVSETRQAKLEGKIQTSTAQYFTDLAQRARGVKPTGFSA